MAEAEALDKPILNPRLKDLCSVWQNDILRLLALATFDTSHLISWEMKDDESDC